MEPEQGDRVRVITDCVTYEGVLMPSTTGRIVIKLDNGYNVGVNKDAQIELVEKIGAIGKRRVSLLAG